MLSSLSPAVLAAVASAGVAVLSFVFNFVVVRRQARVQYEELKLRVDGDILGWGRSAIDALSDAQRLMASQSWMTDTAFEQDRLAAMHRLSSLADQGRLYFPNAILDRHGHMKESAFKGHRPPILHALIFGYYILEHWSLARRADDSAMNVLWRCRRMLVSELQAAVDPRRRARVMVALSKTTGEPAGGRYEEVGQLADAVEHVIPGVLKAKDDRIWVSVDIARKKAKRKAAAEPAT